jgi:hypothetical protein
MFMKLLLYHDGTAPSAPTQRPLPDNTQHSQKTHIRAPAGFKPTIRASERPQTHALDRAATGIRYEVTARRKTEMDPPSCKHVYNCIYHLRILYHQPEDDILMSKHFATLKI